MYRLSERKRGGERPRKAGGSRQRITGANVCVCLKREKQLLVRTKHESAVKESSRRRMQKKHRRQGRKTRGRCSAKSRATRSVGKKIQAGTGERHVEQGGEKSFETSNNLTRRRPGGKNKRDGRVNVGPQVAEDGNTRKKGKRSKTGLLGFSGREGNLERRTAEPLIGSVNKRGGKRGKAVGV